MSAQFLECANRVRAFSRGLEVSARLWNACRVKTSVKRGGFYRDLFCVGVLVFSGFGLVASAVAGPTGYSGKTVPINAGMLVIEGQRTGAAPGVPYNPAPWVFNQLDRSFFKPAGVTFLNPFAETSLTLTTQNRWASIFSAASLPPVGSRLGKNAASYWDVPLNNLSDNALKTYNILALSIQGTAFSGGIVSFNSAEREKLRKYVDQGGVLWIDIVPDGALWNGVLAPIIDRANMPVAFDLVPGMGRPPTDYDPYHPLMNYPNAISLLDLTLMQPGGGAAVGSNYVVSQFDPASIGISFILQPLLLESSRMQDVAGFQPVGTFSQNTVAIFQIGEGYVLLTTRGVTAALCRYRTPVTRIVGSALGVGSDWDSFVAPEPVFDSAFSAAAKLVINAISLRTAFPGVAGGSRKTYSSPVQLTAPLLKSFRYIQGGGVDAVNGAEEGPPTVFNGMTFVRAAGRLMAMNLRPGSDQNQGGIPDLGLPDAPDATFDRIWRTEDFGGGLSSATGMFVPDTTVQNASREDSPRVVNALFASDGSNNCYMYDADQHLDVIGDPRVTLADVTPVSAATVNSSPYSPTLIGAVPPAPTAHENLIVVADNVQQGASTFGRLWLVDPRMPRPTNGIITSGIAGDHWYITGSTRLGPISGSPTVAYIPVRDNSGALDRVIYVPTAVEGNRPAGFASVWLGTKGERPINVTRPGGPGSGQIVVTTRAGDSRRTPLPIYLDAEGGSARGLLGLRVTIIDENGEPVKDAQLGGFITDVLQTTPGVLTITLGGVGSGVSWFDGDTTSALQYSLRLDYTIDWGKIQGNGDRAVRGHIGLPDEIGAPKRRVVGNVGVASNGNIFVVSAPPVQVPPDPNVYGGTVWCFSEEGRGSFNLKSAWEAHERLTLNYLNFSGVQYLPSIINQDPLTALLPFFGGPETDMTKITLTSGPTIQGDTVFVMASSGKGLVPPPNIGTLLAFKAEPPSPEIEVETLGIEAPLPQGYSIVQPSIARSTNKTAPDILSTLTATGQGGTPKITQLPIPGTNRVRLRFNSLIDRDSGVLANYVASNLPIFLNRPGQTALGIEPEKALGQDGLRFNDDFVGGNARGSYSPLLWYTVFHGLEPRGNPYVAGSTLYAAGMSHLPRIVREMGWRLAPPQGLLFGMNIDLPSNARGLTALDQYRPWQRQLYQLLQPAITGEDSFSPYIVWPQIRGVSSPAQFATRLFQNTLPLSERNLWGLVGGEGSLVAWGQDGLHGFSRPEILAVDEGRVGRYDGSGNAIWTTDSTYSFGTEGPSTYATEELSLSRPVKAYEGSKGTTWIVDPGRDRVIHVDQAGRELRSIKNIRLHPSFVPKGYTSSQPLVLRHPSDVLTFTTTVRAANNPFTADRKPLELWRHSVVADTGNYRVVELIDRYELDPVTRRSRGIVGYTDEQGLPQRALSLLLWHTPPELTGKRFAYNSIARTFIQEGAARRIVVAFGFSGSLEPSLGAFGWDPRALEANTGHGGVVIYDGSNQPKVITEFVIDPIAAGVFHVPGAMPLTASWTSVARPEQTKKMTGLTSVTLKYVSTNPIDLLTPYRLAVMITDSDGVFELVQDTAPGSPWKVRWMMNEDAFKAIRRDVADTQISNRNGSRFRPTYARRVDSEDVLVVNSYTGETFGDVGIPALRPLPYFGEVLLLEGEVLGPLDPPTSRGFRLNRRNLGFDVLSINFELPPIQGARNFSVPIFADRR